MRTRNLILTGILGLALVFAFACRSDDGDGGGGDAGVKKADAGGPTTDGGSTGGDGGARDGAGAVDSGPAQTVTVKDINQGKVKDGTLVTIASAIVTAIDGHPPYTGDVYIQQQGGGPFSGMRLYRPKRADGKAIADLRVGDTVKVSGKAVDFKGTPGKPFPNKESTWQISNGSITLLSRGATPVVTTVKAREIAVAKDAQQWENALVRVENARVTSPIDPKFGSYRVSDGTASITVGGDLTAYTPAPTVGDCQSITGIVIYFFGHRLHARSGSDVAKATGCPKPATLTIKDLQDPKSAKHPKVKSAVTVTGVVTAVGRYKGTSGSSAGKYTGFFIQDGTGPYSGIYVFYRWSDTSAVKPAVGRKLQVSGDYDEYFGVSEITGSVTIKDLGAAPVPAAKTLSATDVASTATLEQYEGVLVEVKDAVVASIFMVSGKPRGVILKAPYEVKPSGGKPYGLPVETLLYDFMSGASAPKVGTTFSRITGPLHYSFSKYKIVPDKAANLVVKTP